MKRPVLYLVQLTASTANGIAQYGSPYRAQLLRKGARQTINHAFWQAQIFV
jgi:hypothetical protein